MQFLGDWFVYQKTSSSAKCLVNNYALDSERLGVFKLEQSSVHAVLGLTSRDGRWRYNGELTLRENATSKADLQVKYSLSKYTTSSWSSPGPRNWYYRRRKFWRGYTPCARCSA